MAGNPKTSRFRSMAQAKAKRKSGAPGTPTTLNSARRRKMVTLTLSPEIVARADRQADISGTTRSALVEAALEAYLPQKK